MGLFFLMGPAGPLFVFGGRLDGVGMAADLRNELIALVEPLLVQLGYELVDLQLAGGLRRADLRIFIDRPAGVEGAVAVVGPDGSGVGIDDCERVSREVSALLDVHDPVPSAYTLEVSTPGLDRVLRTPAHFARFVGERVNVEMFAPRDGRRRYTGQLRAVADGTVSVEVDGVEVILQLHDIERARLVPAWPEPGRGPGQKPGRMRKR
jgi:ribosome maturation factor RimP